MNYTPGPWIYEDGDVLGGPGGIACVVPLNSMNGAEEGKANARLIAAAPELLEALNEAFEELNFDGTYTAEEMTRTIAAVRARMAQAIAKVEGKR